MSVSSVSHYKISWYQDNSEHGDDRYKIIEFENRRDVIIIVCDGVSSSTFGRIASYIACDSVSHFFKEQIHFSNRTPLDLFYNIQKSILEDFRQFHQFLKDYKRQIKETQLQFEDEDWLLGNFDSKKKNLHSKQLDELQNKLNKYLTILDVNRKFFLNLIKTIDLQKAQFWTTIHILWLTKLDDIYWRAVCFNLGDGFLLQTNVIPGGHGLDFKDLFFYRSRGDVPPQYGSLKGSVGDLDIKIIFLKRLNIITLGTDGTKIKDLDYNDKPMYQYEYFREFAEFLSTHLKYFENSSELWFNHVKEKTGIHDDFTLVSILLK